MNNLPLAKQVEIISALCEGVGQRAVARLTGTDRKTVARIALRVGRGCAELHDRMFVGLRVHRIECDELWAYVGHKRNPQVSAGIHRHPICHVPDEPSTAHRIVSKDTGLLTPLYMRPDEHGRVLPQDRG